MADTLLLGELAGSGIHPSSVVVAIGLRIPLTFEMICRAWWWFRWMYTTELFGVPSEETRVDWNLQDIDLEKGLLPVFENFITLAREVDIHTPLFLSFLSKSGEPLFIRRSLPGEEAQPFTTVVLHTTESIVLPWVERMIDDQAERRKLDPKMVMVACVMATIPSGVVTTDVEDIPILEPLPEKCSNMCPDD